MDNLECARCGSDKFTVKDKGPHRRLDCAHCERYVKFVNAVQENHLRENNQIVEGMDLFG